MSEINLDRQIASFKKCIFETDINIYMEIRPKYYITLFEDTNYRGGSEVYRLSSGECTTLPTKWRDSVASMAVNVKCVVLFEGENCVGKSRYLLDSHPDLQLRNSNNVIASIKTCDLSFRTPCKSCPKYL